MIALSMLLVTTTAFSKGTDGKPRIVSVNGTISEIICALGYESSLVGTDITSTYPATLAKLPKVGHNRNVSAEGVLALTPTLVLGNKGDMKPQVADQIKAAGAAITLFEQVYSIEGTKQLIKQVADVLGAPAAKVQALNQQIDADIASVKKSAKGSKVLFIYARGTGTMMVSGTGTPVEKMILLAGATNAVKGFEEYKPLTAESVVAANPDVILMFESGLESLGGKEGLMKIQGINQTKAGKNARVVEMDGQLLTGFGPRVGKAVKLLSEKL